MLERQSGFGPHATVQTTMFLVHDSLQHITEQHSLQRYPGLIVYQPCASAQSVAAFVARRIKNQTVFRKATVHILH